MAFIDTSHLVEGASDTTPGWQSLMAQLDMARVTPLRQKPLQAEMGARLRHAQQMLLASVLAAGMIIAVAGAMMIKFL
ncbi:MAG: hypothetical protein P4M09_31510 [Devosia sp.]|nr:hypothetical protein [Devosia sp.]